MLSSVLYPMSPGSESLSATSAPRLLTDSLWTQPSCSGLKHLRAVGIPHFSVFLAAFFHLLKCNGCNKETESHRCLSLLLKNRDNSGKTYITQGYFQRFISRCNDHFKCEMVKLLGSHDIMRFLPELWQRKIVAPLHKLVGFLWFGIICLFFCQSQLQLMKQSEYIYFQPGTR